MEKFTTLKIGKINENEIMPLSVPVRDPSNGLATFTDNPAAVTKSEPAKFVSKMFEARQMAHVFHLQAKGDGAYAEHVALDSFYNGILDLTDNFAEVYAGQYEIIENYEIIDTTDSINKNKIEYFIQLTEFIKNTRYTAILKEDTHLQNIIDEMVSLTYRTLYKLKNLK